MYIGPEVFVPAVMFGSITVMVLGSKWISYKKLSGGASAGGLEAVEKRLARVEVALDDLSAEMGRVAEGQQFLTKVLAERSNQALPPRAGA